MKDLADEIFGADRVHEAEDVVAGLAKAKQILPADGMVVVSGSITLIGDVLKLKQQESANE